MALTITFDTNRVERISREYGAISGSIAWDNSYPTGGESCTDITRLFKTCKQILVEDNSGYSFVYDRTNSKIIGYTSTGSVTNANESAHTHAVALDTGSSAAGSAHTHTSGAITLGALNIASPTFSGTGITAAGQVMTTTDNQTMTLNQCAGMWIIPATGSTAPILILSNTAVTGAPAVFTVQGTAVTDAGAYKVVSVVSTGAATGAESAHTHGPGTLADAASGTGSAHTHTATGGGAAAEITNTTDLSALTAVKFVAIGLI